MRFGDRMRARREELGLKQSELGKMMGVTGSAVGNYETGVSYPKADVLLRAFRALDCDANYLFQDSLELRDAPSPELAELLETIRSLDEHGLRTVRLVAEEEALRMTSGGVSEQTRVIPLYLTPAAAGYVSPAYCDDYVDHIVHAASPADFAVRISGDSMEPYIRDGDLVLVKRQTDLRPGDVGIFYVDGDMKCKQYFADRMGNVYLLSLNRARQDADTAVLAGSGVTLLCYGKVILEQQPPLPKL